MLTLEPGALDITGLEPRNPFALALGLNSLCQRHSLCEALGFSSAHASPLGSRELCI